MKPEKHGLEARVPSVSVNDTLLKMSPLNPKMLYARGQPPWAAMVVSIWLVRVSVSPRAATI